MSNQLKKLSVVNEMLILTKQYDLTAEVVLTCIELAAQYPKEFFRPEVSVISIVLQALDTWDCYPEALVTWEDNCK